MDANSPSTSRRLKGYGKTGQSKNAFDGKTRARQAIIFKRETTESILLSPVSIRLYTVLHDVIDESALAEIPVRFQCRRRINGPTGCGIVCAPMGRDLPPEVEIPSISLRADSSQGRRTGGEMRMAGSIWLRTTSKELGAGSTLGTRGIERQKHRGNW